MERQHFCFISILISGSFREDTYGNAGFHIVCGLKDRFQTLLDILSVEKETVEIAHPVGEQRIMLHFLLGNIAGADRTAAVGEQDVEIAPVVCYIENSLILWNVFFADDGDFGAVIHRMNLNMACTMRRELISLVMGENFPMIHSTRRTGMVSTR